jgi:hypothetical protein
MTTAPELKQKENLKKLRSKVTNKICMKLIKLKLYQGNILALSVSVLLLLLFAVFPSAVAAHGPVYVNAAEGEAPSSIHGAEAGISPEHPLYFMDTFGEKLSLTFTFNKEKRAEKALQIAEEKMAELDHLKEHVVFTEGATTEHLERAFERYEDNMQDAEDSLDKFDANSTRLPEVAEHIAEKRAEHKAAFEEHREVLPERMHARVEEQIKRAEERKAKVLEHVDNPVARAQIEERIAERTQKYVERREEWLDYNHDARKRVEEARFNDVQSPEELEALKLEIEGRFEAIKEKRKEHFELINQKAVEERERIEEERREDDRRLDAAGFDSEEEAIEAYEALDEDGRAKMRDFFGVDKSDADAKIKEVKELRAEHGDEWKNRLEERHRMERERGMEEMREELDFEAEEFDRFDEAMKEEMLLRMKDEGFDPREDVGSIRREDDASMRDDDGSDRGLRPDDAMLEDLMRSQPIDPITHEPLDFPPGEHPSMMDPDDSVRLDFRRPDRRDGIVDDPGSFIEDRMRESTDSRDSVKEREMRDVYIRDGLDLQPGEVLSQPPPRESERSQPRPPQVDPRNPNGRIDVAPPSRPRSTTDRIPSLLRSLEEPTQLRR